MFVADGAVIAASRNFVNEKKNATRHAEMECIDQVRARTQPSPNHGLVSTRR